MARALAKKAETSTSLLEAAKRMLRQNGYSGLSTRDVAAAAVVPLSQIHYHFGSKQGMMLALFEYLNAQLLDRQNALFHNPALKLSEQLTAAGWSDTEVAKVVRVGLLTWFDLLTGLARKAERQLGARGPFSAEEVASLIGCAFMGAESLYLLGGEKKGVPVRQALRRFGDLIRIAEAGSSKR